MSRSQTGDGDPYADMPECAGCEELQEEVARLKEAIQVFRDTYEADGRGTPYDEVQKIIDERAKAQLEVKRLQHELSSRDRVEG